MEQRHFQNTIMWPGMIISFSPLAAPRTNPFIQYRHVRILQDPSQSWMSPGSQKSRNTTSNRLSDSIVWSNCCASWEHEFTNWKCVQGIMNWANFLLTIGHQKFTSILNKVLRSCMCNANGDTWHSYTTTCLKFMGTTLSLSYITLVVRGVF